jgi:very-short-patch-repair endonuclease
MAEPGRAHSVNMLDDAFKSVGEELTGWVRLRYYEVHNRLPIAPQSPVEEAFIAGMVGLNLFSRFFEFDWAMSPFQRFNYGRVRLQQPIGKYRADFLVEAMLGDKIAGMVVVDCDSHKRPVQARDDIREAYMRERGYAVIRFAAPEVVEHPIDCALKVMRLCDELVHALVEQPVEKPVDENQGPIHPQPPTNDPQVIHHENAARLSLAEQDLSPRLDALLQQPPDTHSIREDRDAVDNRGERP